MHYDHRKIESKWQKKWEKDRLYSIDVRKIDPRRKCYCLVMFAYPSGDRLHNGHWFNYGPVDSWARFRRMQGYQVFEPFGFDAFGLPAENYAIKQGVHPQDSTDKNISVMIEQLKKMGAMYDWDYMIESHKSEYYRWTQWLFLRLYEKGLAYRALAPVNWCDSCKTVLANEQVVEGTCERCGTEVYKKNMTQWFFRITDYAEELLSDLDGLDWPKRTVLMQKNWIGKSEGSEIAFKVDGRDLRLKVFSTRPDTLLGVTYACIAPEHPEVLNLTARENRKNVEAYILEASKKAEIERLSTEKTKTGVFTGSYLVNPVNGEKVPLHVADYVLYSYGTGVVMAVPGHDERDFAFARAHGLPIRKVILKEGTKKDDPLVEAYVDEGIMINSGKYDGMKSPEGGKRITEDLKEGGDGDFKTTYRLRDWLVSRQRYWGAPVPIVYCNDCGEVSVPEKDLPVELPYEVVFAKDGKSPLITNEDFCRTKCPKCGKEARREVDTLDTFVCSSWYFLRFPDPKNSEKAFDPDIINKMLPVDKYVGGPEHACMHLLYARFFTKALADMGYLKFREPFTSLTHQGIILAPDGKRMSKSRGNVISPDPYVEKYGSDVFRTYLMFGFNYIDGGPWDDKGIKAVAKFLDRVWCLVEESTAALKAGGGESFTPGPEEKRAERELLSVLHNSIRGVSVDTEKFQFNTPIARIMELLNAFREYNTSVPESKRPRGFVRETTGTLIKLLAPFAPHLTEELWEKMGNRGSVFNASWPEYDPKYLVRDEITMAVQVNGRVRAEITVPVGADEESLKKAALEEENVKKHVGKKPVRKIIVVRQKIVNIVV